jgi:UDP-glucose 4-epimerase
VVSGYIHDKKENDISVLEEQVGLIKEKYTFLYELYQEVSNLKNQFHKQLVGFRDSFGRIYNIVRELDTLDEDEVIFQALRVLEDVMENRSIAIYSIQRDGCQAGCYARLEIYSAGLRGQVAKSLNMVDYPELADSIDKGEIFQNKLMNTGLPAFFVPIKNESTIIGAVAIWNAGYDQQSLYYSNLLTVLCGLIESSINRVSLFMNANLDKFYVPNTRIMYAEHFTKVLRIKNKIKKNKLGSHLIVKVAVENNGREPHRLETLYSLINGVTRAGDYIGMFGDGYCYILFSQADPTNAGAILNRLAQCDITGQIVSDQYPLSIVEEPGRVIVTEEAVLPMAVNRPLNGTGPLLTNSSQTMPLYEGNNSHLKFGLPAEDSDNIQTLSSAAAPIAKPADLASPGDDAQ